MLQPTLGPAKDWLTAQAVHAYLGTAMDDPPSVDTIYRTFEIGRRKLGHKRVRWSRKAIDQWLSEPS